MTTPVESSSRRNIVPKSKLVEEYKITERTHISTDLIDKIFNNMLLQQSIPRNYLETPRLEKLRMNYISWLFRLTTKTEISNQTLFNTISLIDLLFSKVKKELIEEPSNFQLLAITCFYLSYKAFEKKKMTVNFVEKYLLCGQWGEEDIRRAEVCILTIIEYNLHSVNFYSFFEVYKEIILKHFSNEFVNQISYLVNYTMKHSLFIKEFIFNLLPSDQIRIILNTVFLLLSRLSGLDLNNYEGFFIEISKLSDCEIPEFEKYSNMLFSGLRINEEFLQNFTRIQ
jgi:hypothetical protein